MTIYLVDKPFHSLGKFYRPGDIIMSLSEIREGRVRVARREIVAVDPENISALGARLAKIEMKAGRPLREEILTAASAVVTDDVPPVDPITPPAETGEPEGDKPEDKPADVEEPKDNPEDTNTSDTGTADATDVIPPVTEVVVTDEIKTVVDVPVVAKPVVPEMKTTPAKPITNQIKK